jgi:hypothetical protein
MFLWIPCSVAVYTIPVLSSKCWNTVSILHYFLTDSETFFFGCVHRSWQVTPWGRVGRGGGASTRHTTWRCMSYDMAQWRSCRKPYAEEDERNFVIERLQCFSTQAYIHTQAYLEFWYQQTKNFTYHIISSSFIARSWGSSVSVVSDYRLEDRGSIPGRGSLLSSGYGGPVPGVKRGRGVTLTTHPYLVPTSGMSRSYTSSPPWRLHGGSGTALLKLVFILLSLI